MKYCRFQFHDQLRYGLVETFAGVERISHLLTVPPERAGTLRALQTEKIDAISLSEAKLAAPVEPSKIICVGRNYMAHAAEMKSEVPKQPLIFFKPPSSLLANGKSILRPKVTERMDYEGELGAVIGQQCHKLAPSEDVRPYILGYTAVNDVTARDLQKTDNQWTRAKGFDTFCPVGPLVTDEIDPWAGVDVETRVNRELRQKGNTRDFVFPLDILIRYIAEVMTLHPGDLISTGTPEGVGAIVAGDVVEVTVPAVGTLRNPVADE